MTLAKPSEHSLAQPASGTPRAPVLVYLASLDSEHSRRAMLVGLKRALRVLGSPANPLEFPWEQVRRPEFVALRAQLVAKYSPACVNQSLSAVRGALREAFRAGLLGGDEWKRLEDVPGVSAERLPAGRDVPEDELQKLFAACDRSDPVGVRDAALLAVLRVTGMRRHEVCKVAYPDGVDLRDGKLTVVGKRNKERTCYIGDAQVEVEAWLEVRGPEPGPLFLPWCAQSEEFLMRPLTDGGVYWVLKRAADRAGVELSPHDLRRTATGDMLDAGVDLATVQRALGHASPTTTARYDRRGERTKREAAQKLKVPR